MVSKLFTLVLVFGIVNAAVYIDLHPKKPKEFENQEGCYIEELNSMVPYGTHTPIGHCLRIQCSEGMIDYATCGVVFTNDKKCHVTDEDLSKPYPDCCPTVKCDVDNKIE